jgi:GTP-binding protein LepA
MSAQVLDSNPIERERGITIKAQSVSLPFTAKDGQTYQLNFIDTPGHVDFSYEVSRSLAACEGRVAGGRCRPGRRGAVGGQLLHRRRAGPRSAAGAQQDRPAAPPMSSGQEGIEAVIGIHADEALQVSAKTGLNVRERSGSHRRADPATGAARLHQLQALIIDSWFDNYLGVVSLVRVMQGEIKPKRQDPGDVDRPRHQVDQVGIFTPKRTETDSLGPARWVSWCASIKEVHGAPVGDT